MINVMQDELLVIVDRQQGKIIAANQERGQAMEELVSKLEADEAIFAKNVAAYGPLVEMASQFTEGLVALKDMFEKAARPGFADFSPISQIEAIKVPLKLDGTYADRKNWTINRNYGVLPTGVAFNLNDRHYFVEAQNVRAQFVSFNVPESSPEFVVTEIKPYRTDAGSFYPIRTPIEWYVKTSSADTLLKAIFEAAIEKFPEDRLAPVAEAIKGMTGPKLV